MEVTLKSDFLDRKVRARGLPAASGSSIAALVFLGSDLLLFYYSSKGDAHELPGDTYREVL